MSIHLFHQEMDITGPEPIRKIMITPEEAVLFEDSGYHRKIMYGTEEDYIEFCKAYDEEYRGKFNRFLRVSADSPVEPRREAVWVYPGVNEICTIRNRTYVYVDGIEFMEGSKNNYRFHYALALASPAYITPIGYPKIYPLLRHTSKALSKVADLEEYLCSTRDRIVRSYFLSDQPAIDYALAKKPHKVGLPSKYYYSGYTNEFDFQAEHGFTVI